MHWKLLAGLVLGFAIGLGCNLLAIPVPAPPALAGAALVVAMTAGYQVTDRLMGSPAQTAPGDCGGPVGGRTAAGGKP